LGSISSGISTTYLDVKTAIGATALQMNTGSALQLIFLGLGNVFCVPLTLSKFLSDELVFYLMNNSAEYGRRPIYLGTMIVLLAAQLLQMSMKTVEQFYGSYILAGIGAAPFDVLVEISVGLSYLGSFGRLLIQGALFSFLTSHSPTREGISSLSTSFHRRLALSSVRYGRAI
jgi:hypothetical protein